MLRPRLSRLLFAALFVVLAGCDVAVDVDLDVASDGSGEVTIDVAFDPEANATLGDLAQRLRASDLETSGWVMTISEAGDGSATVTATKRVGGPDQWQQTLDEVVGPGVFNNVTVESDRAFATSSQRLDFDLELGDGWELFADDALTEELGGEPFGAPIDTLINGREIDDIVSINLTVSVSTAGDGATVVETREPRFDADPLQLRLVSTSENSTAILLRWIAIALFLLFGLATVLAGTGIWLQRRADRRRPAPTPASLVSRVPGAAVADGARVDARPRSPAGAVRLVVIDPLTVLYKRPLNANTYVLEFVRELGGAARADKILSRHEAVTLGEISTQQFWQDCGLNTPVDIDALLVRRRQMRRGAAAFLAEMERRRIAVAATTTDGKAWSRAARTRDRLSKVWPWLVSAEVGTVAGTVAMFEVLHRESGVAYEHCLYIDTNEQRLDVARDLGMKTVLFAVDEFTDVVATSHAVVTDFKALV